MKARCGRRSSRSGQPFVEETLRQHEADCPRCRALDDVALEAHLADEIVGDDEPDGVYHATRSWLDSEW